MQVARSVGEATPLLGLVGDAEQIKTDEKSKCYTPVCSDAMVPKIDPCQRDTSDLKSHFQISSPSFLESAGERLSCLTSTKERALMTSIVASGATLSPLFLFSESYFGKMIAGVDFFFNAAYMRNEAKDNSVDLKNMHKTMVDTTTFNMIATTLPLTLNFASKTEPSTYALEVVTAAAVVAINQGVFMMVTGDEEDAAAIENQSAPNDVLQQVSEDTDCQQKINKRDTAIVSILSTAGKLALMFDKMKHESHNPSDECLQMTTALQGLWILGRIVVGLEKNVRPISSSGPAMLNGLITLMVAQAFAVALTAVSDSPDGKADNAPADLLKVLVASKIGGEIVHTFLKGMIYAFKHGMFADTSNQKAEAVVDKSDNYSIDV